MSLNQLKPIHRLAKNNDQGSLSAGSATACALKHPPQRRQASSHAVKLSAFGGAAVRWPAFYVMNTSNHIITRYNYDFNIQELRLLFRKCCDPLPNAPEDEYDSIILHIILKLISEEGINNIGEFVLSEFKQKWKISIPISKALTVSTFFYRWWYLGKSPIRPKAV